MQKHCKKAVFLQGHSLRLSHKFIERFAVGSHEWQLGNAMQRVPHTGAARTSRRSRLHPIALSDDEHRQLVQWSRQRRSPRALRARIVLSCRHGCSNREVAGRLGVTTQTVGKWRGRFVSARLQGLLDQPRSGAPRSISDELVAAVLAKTLHEQPPGAERWSSRRLANELGISQRAVLRIWRTFEL